MRCYPLEVVIADDKDKDHLGEMIIQIRQWNGYGEDEDVVLVTPDQVNQLINWLETAKAEF